MERAPVVALSLLSLAILAPQGCSKRNAHGGGDPVYPLRGLHAAVPCEGCHGSGTPRSLPTECVECHEDDRPDPGHNPGLDCVNCHVEDGWDVGVTTETGLTIIEDTAVTPTTPTTDHIPIPDDQLCWDCHEVDRKDPKHYTSPNPIKSWDCGPCHGLNSWTEDLYDHPARTPHGNYGDNTEQPRDKWAVACSTCHPNDVLTDLDCSTCHLDIFAPTHFGDATEPYVGDRGCLVCHINGDL